MISRGAQPQILNDGCQIYWSGAMAREHTHAEMPAALAGLDPARFFETGKKRVEYMVEMQAKFLDTLQGVNREWLERAQSEAGLAAEFWNKLAVAKSVPEAAIAYQDWASRRIQMFAEDGQRVLSDGQKLVEAGSKLFGNGWAGGNS